MVNLDKAIIGSYSQGGKDFEVYLDPDKALMYKEGRKKDLNNILVVEEIFSDAKKGERAKSSDLIKVFGTTDIMQILEVILKKGKIQLTTEQRRKKVEEKRKQIINLIHRETIDPRTKAPHTIERISNALDEAKVKIDPFKDAEEQLPEIIKKIKLILPIKFEKVKIAIKIPSEYAYKAYGTLKNIGIQQEQWLKNGDLVVVVEMPAGAQGEFYHKLNKLTNGNNETKIIS